MFVLGVLLVHDNLRMAHGGSRVWQGNRGTTLAPVQVSSGHPRNIQFLYLDTRGNNTVASSVGISLEEIALSPAAAMARTQST
jgi:hypothetical protein